MKVIATAKGYFGQVRDVGAEFEVPDDAKPASWFAPVDAAPASQTASFGKQHGKGRKPDPDADPI